MKTFLINDKGWIPIPEWQPNCWINIQDPTQEELEYLLNDLEVPASFLDDIEDPDERPRIEVEDGWRLIILRIPIRPKSSMSYTTVPLGIMLKGEIVLTVCLHLSDMIPDFILYTRRKQVECEDAYDLMLQLLLSSSVWFLKYLKQINISIKMAEVQLERSIRNQELQILMNMEKYLVFFITSLKGNDILFHKIKNLKPQRDYFDRDLLDDVAVELKQAQESANVYGDILSSMMDAYASVISNNLNTVLHRLTVISIMLMVPTLVASFYGMNVPNFLEENKYAFYALAVGSCFLSAIVFVWYRKTVFKK